MPDWSGLLYEKITLLLAGSVLLLIRLCRRQKQLYDWNATTSDTCDHDGSQLARDKAAKQTGKQAAERTAFPG